MGGRSQGSPSEVGFGRREEGVAEAVNRTTVITAKV